MNRPNNIEAYEEVDLKLGIKSSLPHAKSTIALSILLWECAGFPAELIYSKQKDDGIVLVDQLVDSLNQNLSEIYTDYNLDSNETISIFNNNQLLKSQAEALMVAFELVWKIAKVDFVDSTKAASSERKGGKRYPKKLMYTNNIDIIHNLISNNKTEYFKVLLSWASVNVEIDTEYEKKLTMLLSILTENAVFKLVNGANDVIFNLNSVYDKLINTEDAVDINGDKEAKGSLRILKSLLSDKMNPFLNYSFGKVTMKENIEDHLREYKTRVETMLKLSSTKVIGIENISAATEGISIENDETYRLTNGTNILLYGVPGSGKSWTIENEYCKENSNVERLVFHPDYTYSDFIGQILPNVSEDGQVSYKYTPGPFTTILRDAYQNPTEEYILIIEEINRGNAPAIFGEVFQLLDRKTDDSNSRNNDYPMGTSEYGITNTNMAKIVYSDQKQKIRIPSNLSIIGTMNTSDQNVFTLDTAFQRRWEMRLIESNFDYVDKKLADKEILDTGISWKNFCTEINNVIVGNNARMTSAEDKRLGAYFITYNDLVYNDNMGSLSDGEYDGLRKKEQDGTITPSERERIIVIREAMKQNRKFPEKIIKYLWDYAFKFNREIVFETTDFQSLEQVIKVFMRGTGMERFIMFKENIRNAFINPEI